jgi:lysophospholipase L1-like esterase
MGTEMGEPGARSLRICLVGDSIAAGTGDEAGLGWHGRLASSAWASGVDVTIYGLGVRGDTTLDVAGRWQQESVARLPSIFPSAIVFQFGLNDCAVRTTDAGESSRRVALGDSLRTLRRVLLEATRMSTVLMVGPAPVDDDRPGPQLVAGLTQRLHNRDIGELDAAFAQVAGSSSVPYLRVFDRLMADEAWSRAVRSGDGIHPTGEGYQALAAIVHVWSAWRALLDRAGDRG